MIKYTIWVGHEPTQSHVRKLTALVSRTQRKLKQPYGNHLLCVEGPFVEDFFYVTAGAFLNISREKHPPQRFCVSFGKPSKEIAAGSNQILII